MIMVELHPGFNPLYHSYYLEGILYRFGPKSVRFSTRDFPGFKESGLALRIPSLNLKIFIDALDWDGYDEDALTWCDRYAKVNFNPDKIPGDNFNHIIPVGPGFGIKIRWGFPFQVRILFNIAAHYRAIDNMRSFLKNYWLQAHERRPLLAYYPGATDPGYIFHLSSIWAPDDTCNRNRLAFIKAAYSVKGIHFEGGFSPPARVDVPECTPYVLDRHYTLQEYLSRVQRSVVVFNTPAVLDCHGWKLGEYLALGKAVISTPLSRELPEPLIHGEHFHMVDGSVQSIQEAIDVIRFNTEYRIRLEKNARLYFLRCLHPWRVIERIISPPVESTTGSYQGKMR